PIPTTSPGKTFSERPCDVLTSGSTKDRRVPFEPADACPHHRRRLHFFDGERYELGCYVIMPNHRHAVVRPCLCEGEPIERVLQSWKRHMRCMSTAASGARALYGKRRVLIGSFVMTSISGARFGISAPILRRLG